MVGRLDGGSPGGPARPAPVPAASDGGLSAVSSPRERSPEALFAAAVDNVRSVLFASDDLVGLAVGCFAAGGHLLVEDLPGLGKTTFAKALARSFGLEFRRVQCTADLLPADITGAMVYDTTRGEPIFRKGPIFTNVLMADELNRASARTQSALLESMEERQVSVDGHAERLPAPFLVVATQNPHDFAGTSPLPHGQRDRFLVRLSMGYPDRPSEDALLAGGDPAEAVVTLAPVITSDELRRLAAEVDGAHVSPAARAYILDLVAASRAHPSVQVGASPRAARAVMRMSRAMAVADGRDFVVPDDVRSVAVPVLAHRLILDPRSALTGADAEVIVHELLDSTPVPVAGPVG